MTEREYKASFYVASAAAIIFAILAGFWAIEADRCNARLAASDTPQISNLLGEQ